MDLSANGLVLSLGSRRVLDGVAARFRPGRVTAILGPNGSGKSTLVKALAGLLMPETGEVRLGDTAVASLAPRERARAIGYLPQDATVHWDIAVRELVGIGRLPHRSPFAGPSAADLAAVAGAMASTGVTDFAERRIDTLSGGERARVLLARVLAGEPGWLLADEPLASLDPAHQLDILDRLRNVAAGGAGVILVLHDLVQAARAADEILLLKQGRAVAFGPPSEALTPAAIRNAFGVDVMLVPDAEGRLLPIPTGR